MDLTRNSDITVIERIKRERVFAQRLLRSVLRRLLNRTELEIAQALLRQLATAILEDDAQAFQSALSKDHPPVVEELNPIYDALWEKLVKGDPNVPLFDRHTNQRAFYEKHRNDPPEPGGVMAISPEWYRELCGDKSTTLDFQDGE